MLNPLAPFEEVVEHDHRVVFRTKTTNGYLAPAVLFGIGAVAGVPSFLLDLFGLGETDAIWLPGVALLVFSYAWLWFRPRCIVDFRVGEMHWKSLFRSDKVGFDDLAAMALEKKDRHVGYHHALGSEEVEPWHLYAYKLPPAGSRAAAYKLGRDAPFATPIGIPADPDPAESSVQIGDPGETLQRNYDEKLVFVTPDYSLINEWTSELCERAEIPRFDLASLH